MSKPNPRFQDFTHYLTCISNGFVAPFNFYALISVDNEDGKTATGRWWDLWTGAVAINAMCVRNSKAGAAVFEEGLRIKIDRRWS